LGALALLLGGVVTCGQNEAQGGAWSALSAPAMDPSKLAVTENVDFARDRVHIKLVNGTIQFGAPTNGIAKWTKCRLITARNFLPM
jgi:hypothetical protein